MIDILNYYILVYNLF